MDKISQNEAILSYLQAGNTLTALEALEKFGCFRLASRISDLKLLKNNITSEMIYAPNGKKYARYRLFTKVDSRGQLLFV